MKYDTETIKDIQRIVGAKEDGLFGPETVDRIVEWRHRHSNIQNYNEFVRVWYATQNMNVSEFVARERRVVGLDLSHHQGAINFEKVIQTGIGFVICKATEGRTYQDPMYEQYMAQLRSYDIATGAYHYCHLVNGAQQTDPRAGAEHFLRVVGDELPQLPLVVDLETERVEMLTRLRGQQASADWISTFVQTLVDQTKRRPMLYWSRRIFDPKRLGPKTLQFAHLPTWWARYVEDIFALPAIPPDHPEGWGWQLWQCTNKGVIDGINAKVDVNIFAGDRATFTHWLDSVAN